MTDYRLLEEQIKGLAEISGEMVSLMSNASALLYEALSDVNWAGFYIVRPDATDKTAQPIVSEPVLLVGPFQGKVACVRIEKGKGVCGTAWEEDKTQLVPDVHKFPGHIACDSASNSEIVIPIHHNGEVVAVLDIDSPLLGRFTEDDKVGLEGFVRTLEKCMEYN